MISDVPTIIIAVTAVLALLVAWHQYRLAHSDHVSASLKSTILAVITDALEPIKNTLNIHTSQLLQHSDRDLRTDDRIKENSKYIRDLSDKMTQMGVKVDMYWTTLEQLAMNAAKGLHQPDPARAYLDGLLEAFVEGTLTSAERIELRKLLVLIRNYEPAGPPLNFPVHQGEQTFAAILLSTMDVVDPLKMATMGHSLHRSIREKENRINGDP